MKPLRLISLLLLVSLLWWGAREKIAVDRLRIEHGTLIKRAVAIGLPERESDEVSEFSRITKRATLAGKIPAADLKNELVSAFRRLKSLETETDPETRLKVEEEVREWIGRLSDLSPKELKQVVEDLSGDSALAKEDRTTLMSLALSLAATRQSETAAELALAHHDEIGYPSGIFESWGKVDPSSAFAWLEKNREALGNQYQNSIGWVIGSSAGRDPALALAALSKLDGKSRVEAANRLARNLSDEGAREALLTELRLAPLAQADGSEVLKGLGNGMASTPCGEEVSWMGKLSESESVNIAEGITQSDKSLDHPATWLDWMGKSLLPEKVVDTAKPLLTKWINDDYEAAGEWINKQPPGDFRNDAAANYSRMLLKRFPDTARDWANTLPEGSEKRQLLEDLTK
jgi:hypothetical protein